MAAQAENDQKPRSTSSGGRRALVSPSAPATATATANVTAAAAGAAAAVVSAAVASSDADLSTTVLPSVVGWNPLHTASRGSRSRSTTTRNTDKSGRSASLTKQGLPTPRNATGNIHNRNAAGDIHHQNGTKEKDRKEMNTPPLAADDTAHTHAHTHHRASKAQLPSVVSWMSSPHIPCVPAAAASAVPVASPVASPPPTNATPVMPATAALVHATAGAHVIPTRVAKEEAQKEGTVRIASQVDSGVSEGEGGGEGEMKTAEEEEAEKKLKQTQREADDRIMANLAGLKQQLVQARVLVRVCVCGC